MDNSYSPLAMRRGTSMSACDDFLSLGLTDMSWHPTSALEMDFLGHGPLDHDQASAFGMEVSPHTTLPSPQESNSDMESLEPAYAEPQGVSASPPKRSYSVVDVTSMRTPHRKHYDGLGLVTPLSVGASWPEKHDFLTPMSTPLATPLATPLPLGESEGVNPFYNPPQCMRPASSTPRNLPTAYPPMSHHDAMLRTVAPRSVSMPSLVSRAASVAAMAAAAAATAASVGTNDSSLMLGTSPLHLESAERQPQSPTANCKESTVVVGSRRRCDSQSNAQVQDVKAEKPEKPFGCVQCTKSFRRMEHLRRHIKIHTMERPYMCEVPGCERKFSRSDNLKAHLKTHTKRSGRNVYVEGLEQAVNLVKRRKT